MKLGLNKINWGNKVHGGSINPLPRPTLYFAFILPDNPDYILFYFSESLAMQYGLPAISDFTLSSGNTIEELSFDQGDGGNYLVMKCTNSYELGDTELITYKSGIIPLTGDPSGRKVVSFTNYEVAFNIQDPIIDNAQILSTVTNKIYVLFDKDMDQAVPLTLTGWSINGKTINAIAWETDPKVLSIQVSVPFTYGSSYHFSYNGGQTIRSSGGGTLQPFSNQPIFNGLPEPDMIAPYGLSVTPSYISALLQWTNNNPYSYYDGVSIERSLDNLTWAEVATVEGYNIASYNGTGLSMNTQYYWRVRAFRTRDSVKTYTSYSNTTNATTLGGVPFITTWKTDNAGDSNSTSIRIPKVSGSAFTGVIDWKGDGTVMTSYSGNIDGYIEHNYGVTGTYTVKIYGAFPNINFNLTGDLLKILSIEQWGATTFTTCEKAFASCQNLVANYTDYPDTSSVTNFTFMFCQCNKFNGLIEFDTSHGVLFYSMFASCSVFNQDITNLVTGNATNINYMLSNCSVFNGDISGWNTSNVTRMENCFYYCSAFNQPVDHIDISKIMLINSMFSGCHAFNQLITTWDTSRFTDFGSMFSGCYAFNKSVAFLDTSNCNSMSYMFSGCRAFNQSVMNLDTMKVTAMSGMFSDCRVFNQSVDAFDTSSVTYMNNMFDNCRAFNQSVIGFRTTNVLDMSYMFLNCYIFNQSVSTFNTSKVTTMRDMFNGCYAFNQSIANFDTTLVTDMQNMFNACTVFNQSVSTLITSKVTNMSGMFGNCIAFDQSVSSFDTSKVTNMSSMFAGCSIFNHSITTWDTSKVTNMSYMFLSCSLFNSALTFDTSKVTTMTNMFKNCSYFNQSVASFDTSKVTLFSGMFEGCSSFNQPVSTFDTSLGYFFSGMFKNCIAFNQSVSNFNTSGAIFIDSMFYGCTVFNQSISNFNTSKINSFAYFLYHCYAFDQDISGLDYSHANAVWGLNGILNLGDSMTAAFSTANYDLFLISLANQLSNSQQLYMGLYRPKYSSTGATARNHLTGTHGWNINDGGSI